MTDPTRLLLLADTHVPAARPRPARRGVVRGRGGRPRDPRRRLGGRRAAGRAREPGRQARRVLRQQRRARAARTAARGRPCQRRRPAASRWSTRPARRAGARSGASAAFPDVDVLVFGHSHIPWDTTTPRGLRLLNPGSPTDRRRQPHCTWMTATVADGACATYGCTGGSDAGHPRGGLLGWRCDARGAGRRGSAVGAAPGRRVAQPVEEADDRPQQQVARRPVRRRGVRPGRGQRLDALDARPERCRARPA